MAIIWYEYALIAAMFAGILLLLGLSAFGFMRVRVQKWIGGAIGNFMTNLANQAAEEEGGSSPGASPAGVLELGGFKIDPAMIKMLMELYKMAKEIGILGPGGLGGLLGGGGGGSSSGKIGL